MATNKTANLFKGLSMLRAEERKAGGAQAPAQNSAMAEYLKRYADGSGTTQGAEKPKRKKKKAAAAAASGGAIKLIDEDVQGQAQTRRGLGSDSDDDDFKPVIENEAEARFMLEQKKKAQEFYQKKQDGSGWETITHEQSHRHQQEDASPPRRKQRHDSPDALPVRKPINQDAGPLRRRRHDSPDASPPRKTADSDLDASPPRRRARHDTPDASPIRRPAAVNGTRDLSPPRRAGAHHSTSDASPPRKPAQHASPPRRQQHVGSDMQDASPPRRRARHDSPDAAVPRRSQAHDSSPPRRPVRHDSPDASPVRRPSHGDVSPPRRRHDSPDASPPRQRQGVAGAAAKMTDGTAVGLVNAKQLAAEMSAMQQEREAKRLAAAGRGAETVYRDKATGKIVSKDDYVASKSKDNQKGKKQEAEEQHLEWKTGLAQRKAAQAIAARMAEEAQKPFARYADDKERDAILKSKVLFGDPMAHLVKSKIEEPDAITQRYDIDKLQESGFVIPQGIPPHSWIKRGVAAPANRYNIRPGRHWDGVDRSNGFERNMFKHQATVQHREQQAREWSMADM